MEVTTTFKPADRAAWREWLAQNHQSASEVWLLLDTGPNPVRVSYLDAVEEALCFGWIDGIAKRTSSGERAQRLTPRRPRGRWTELNKVRALRLISLGLMTDAGRATLPDLTAEMPLAADIEARLRAEPGAWTNFQAFPHLYRRIRVGYIEGTRPNPIEFERSLSNFVRQSAANRMFGNWNDGGRLG